MADSLNTVLLHKPASNSAKSYFYQDNSDILQVWLADMDFSIMDGLKNNLIEFVLQGDLGYSFVPETYLESIVNWHKNYLKKPITEQMIVPICNSIYGLACLIQRYTEIGDNIAVFSPYYHSFADCVINNERAMLAIPLVEKDHNVYIDFEVLESLMKYEMPKMLIVCNPHNPTGKVLKHAEIMYIINLCRKYDVFIVCDEIHMDFCRDSLKNSMIDYLDSYEKLAIISSPSKTFNIAGMKIANLYIKNEEVLQSVKVQIKKNGAITPNTMGLRCAEFCYRNGKEWSRQVNRLIENNRMAVEGVFDELKDYFYVFKSESTYFLWIKILFDVTDVSQWFLDKCKIRIEDGRKFGNGFEKYARITLATDEHTINEIIRKIRKGLENVKY